MRLSGFHINGFGIYHEHPIQEIPEGIIVFLGNNEGGKTTLMEFIRSILFGFPKKGKNDYRPLRGGSYGGRLRLTMQDGRLYTIERLEKKVVIIDDGGKAIQEEPSNHFFGAKINRQIFESVFAIGLDDLKGLGVLSNENVKGWTLTGAGAASLPKILGDINKNLADLLKPRATGAEINSFLKELDSVKKEIHELQSESSEYTEQQNRRDELIKQVGESKIERESINQRLLRIKQLEQARDHWINLCSVKVKLEELEYANDFPAKGLERFEILKGEIESKLIEKNSLENQIKRLETQFGMIDVDENIINQKSIIESLMRERQKFISAIEDFPVRVSEMKQKENYFNDQLHDFGTDWDSEKLANVDTSIQTRHRVQDFSRDLGEAEIRYGQAQDKERSHQELEKEARLSYEEAQRIYEDCPVPSIKDMQEIKQQRDVLGKISLSLHQHDILTIQLVAKRESLQRTDESIESLEKKKKAQDNLLPPWLWLPVLGAGIVISAFLAILGYYKVSLIVFVSSGALSVLMRLNNKGYQAREMERIEQIGSEIGKYNKIKSNVTKEISDIEEKLGLNSIAINEFASSIGFNSDINQVELEKMDGFLRQAEEKLRDWHSKEQKEKELKQILQKSQEKLEKSKQESSKSQKNLEELKEKWVQWITQRGFDENIRPDGFDVILQMVQNARDAQDSFQQSSNRVKQINDYIDEACKRIRNAMRLCNITPTPDDVGAAEMDKLNEFLDSAIESKGKQEKIFDKLEDAKLDLEKLRAELESKQNELNELLNNADTENEEVFRSKAKSYGEWVEYNRQAETNDLKLLAIAGNTEALAELLDELKVSDPISLQSEKSQITDKLQDLEKQSDIDNQEIGRLTNKLEEMLQDERLSELLFRQKTLQEQLKDAIKRWATLVTTRYLLDKTRSKFERERQPKVIQEASRFIKTITDRQYRLMTSVTDQNVYLLDEETLSHRDEIGLSSGLADQIYLTIRLGLASEFAQHTEPLPIIFDDVLVRFDPTRQLGIAKVMLEIAQSHQILMFSCHPEIRDIMEKAKHESGICNVNYYMIEDGHINMQ